MGTDQDNKGLNWSKAEETAACRDTPEGYGHLGPQPLWPGALPGSLHRGRIRRLPRLSGDEREEAMSAANPYYAALDRVLEECFAQAASGKGAERHTDGHTPFTSQFICEGQRLVGIGFGLGQAIKKVLEANRMAERGQRDKATHELRGAINYIAATIIVLDEEVVK